MQAPASKHSRVVSCLLYGLGAASALVAPPVLMSAARQHAPVLRALAPDVSLAVVRSSPAPDAPLPAPKRAVAIEPLPSGEVDVQVENVNTRETATFSIAPSGRTRPEQAIAIETFFRCRRTGKHRPLGDGVLALLVDVAQRWPDRVIEIVSGYRAPPFGAPHSRHFQGQAIDLRVRGVRTALVRDFVWRRHHGVGVGHYAAQNFVHIDVRPDEADVAWSAAREDAPPVYDPRWATRARRTRPHAARLAVLAPARL